MSMLNGPISFRMFKLRDWLYEGTSIVPPLLSFAIRVFRKL